MKSENANVTLLIGETQTRIAKCDIFRKKSTRYFCCKCRGIVWDHTGIYQYCPLCGREIVRGVKE